MNSCVNKSAFNDGIKGKSFWVFHLNMKLFSSFEISLCLASWSSCFWAWLNKFGVQWNMTQYNDSPCCQIERVLVWLVHNNWACLLVFLLFHLLGFFLVFHGSLLLIENSRRSWWFLFCSTVVVCLLVIASVFWLQWDCSSA